MLMYVPSCADDQVRVDSPLSLVQRSHKCLPVSCAHLHDIPSYWGEVNGVEEDIRAGREREKGVGETQGERRKEKCYIVT